MIDSSNTVMRGAPHTHSTGSKPDPTNTIESANVPVTTALLLVNLGTPEAPTPAAVFKFLREFLFDARVVNLPLLFRLMLQLILPFRAKRVAKLYQRIWLQEGSPLQVYTERLGQALAYSLRQTQQECVPVYTAMTYGNPNIEIQINDIIKKKIERLIVIPLFPQYSKATTAAVWDKLAKALMRHSFVPSLIFINEYTNDDLYVLALAESITLHWSLHGRGERLLFSFHGIPKRNVLMGETYPLACKRLGDRVAKMLKIPENSYEISFQSRFGAAPWVTPYTDQLLTNWGNLGVQSVDVISPSFAVDCLETLEELNIQMREIFLKSGGKTYQYIPALNDSPAHVMVLKGLIQKFF